MEIRKSAIYHNGDDPTELRVTIKSVYFARHCISASLHSLFVYIHSFRVRVGLIILFIISVNYTHLIYSSQ